MNDRLFLRTAKDQASFGRIKTHGPQSDWQENISFQPTGDTIVIKRDKVLPSGGYLEL